MGEDKKHFTLPTHRPGARTAVEKHEALDNRPDKITIMIRTAELWSHLSTCTKPNGAVIAKNGHVISIGYNGSPKGHEHCLEEGCLAGPDSGCIRTIHAETNAIAVAARYGISTEGASIFTTSFPCRTCAKLIIASGINEVYYLNDYRDMSGAELFGKSKISYYKVEIEPNGRCNLKGQYKDPGTHKGRTNH